MSAGEDKPATSLSALDRKLLKLLLLPNGDLKSSKSLSTKLGIPITTVRRRRKRLESLFSVNFPCQTSVTILFY